MIKPYRRPLFLHLNAAVFISFVLLAVSVPLAVASGSSLTEADIALGKKTVSALDRKRSRTVIANIRLIRDPLLKKTLMWLLYTQMPGAANWQELAAFVTENRGWPKNLTLRKHTEERMAMNDSLPEAVGWLQEWPPVTARGKALQAGWLLDQGREREAVALLRETWVEGTFNRRDERWFYKTYRRHLTREDNEARLERLLWEGKNGSARRMFYRVNEDLRHLTEARYLLRHMRGNVDAAIARVPQRYKQHPGLVYERLRWRRSKGKDQSARSLLDDPPDPLPYSELWFREREILSRRALRKGLVTVAYDLIADHGIDPGLAAPFSSAEWLAGWIALSFLKEPQWAYAHFTAMYEVVRFPVSVARAAYWAGRAASAMEQHDQAALWYARAAQHPTTYYGQLAHSRTGQSSSGLFAATSHDTHPAGPAFEHHELVRAIRLLQELNARHHMRAFFTHLKDIRPDDRDWQVAVGNLATEAGRHDLAIDVAKSALRNGLLLHEAGYPLISLPDPPGKAVDPAAEEALVYALIRQESAFFPLARSSADARGLMQIMPATAKLTARSVGLRYNRDRLTADPEYNLRLGQAYLSEMLGRFEGSYVLGLAAYNAGPHRAKAWIKAHGDPRAPTVDVIDWVEMIPFEETRNYVQRVLENLQVYRARLDNTELAHNLNDDLLR